MAKEVEKTFSAMTVNKQEDPGDGLMQVRSALGMETRKSKGLVPRLASPALGAGNKLGVPPKVDVNLFKEMVLNDETVSAAVDTLVDVSTVNGYDFFSKKETKLARTEVKKLHDLFRFELNYDEIQDNILRNLAVYGYCLLELRKTKAGKIKELHVLETPEIWIRHDDHGEIHGYVQNRQDTGDGPPRWTTKEIIYYTAKKLGSQVYPQFPFEPVARDYATNVFAEKYLQQLFRNMPPRMLYTLENANMTQRKVFIQNLNITKQKQVADIVALGKADPKMLVPEFGSIIEILKFLRQQVLSVTRVPGFFLGIGDEGSNRGNSEARIFAFETRIRKLQQIIEQKNNTELLPALGFSNAVFKFNPFSLKDEKTLLENAEKMRAMGIKKEKVSEFLTMRGLTVNAEDIEDVTEQLGKDVISMDRPRMDKKNQDMKTNLNAKGSSDLSPKKDPNLDTRALTVTDGYDQYEEEYVNRQNGKRKSS